MDKRTRNSVIIAAVILLIIAFIWKIAASQTSVTKRIAKALSAHGCEIRAEELRPLMHEKNTSIKALTAENGADMSKAVIASREAGFNADIEKTGEVYLLLADMNAGKAALTVFVVDGKIELAFIQIPDSDEVFPVNAGYIP